MLLRFTVILLVVLFGSNMTNAQCLDDKQTCLKDSVINCPQASIQCKKYFSQIQKQRAIVNNALFLTDEQVKFRDSLMCENSPIFEQKFNELIKESYKLKALKCAGACRCEILNQKKVVDCIKKEISKLVDEENKVFKKCLTGEQRAKYSMIKKLERIEQKRVNHQKDYYKANPKMKHFGNPPVCSG